MDELQVWYLLAQAGRRYSAALLEMVTLHRHMEAEGTNTERLFLARTALKNVVENLTEVDACLTRAEREARW